MKAAISFIQKRELACLMVILVMALVIRVAWASVAGRVDPALKNNPLYGDASGYHQLAVNLNNGMGFSWDGITPTYYRMPGYPVFLAIVYRIAGTNVTVVRIIQAILGALFCVPIWLLAKKIGGAEIAIPVTFLNAVYPLPIYMTGWLYTETLYLTLLYFFLFLLVSAYTAQARKRLFTVLAGLFLALLTYLRCQSILFPIGIAGVMIVSYLISRSKALLQQFKTLGVVTIVCLILVLPWMVRNYAVAGTMSLSADFGINLWGGNNPDADGTFKPNAPFVKEGMSEAESSRYYTTQALDWIMKNPAQYLALLPKKISAFFSPLTMTTARGLFSFATVFNIVQDTLLLFSAIGFIFLFPKKEIFNPYLGIVAVFMGLTLLFFGGTRLVIPIYPILIFTAYVGVYRVIQHFRLARKARQPVLLAR